MSVLEHYGHEMEFSKNESEILELVTNIGYGDIKIRFDDSDGSRYCRVFGGLTIEHRPDMQGIRGEILNRLIDCGYRFAEGDSQISYSDREYYDGIKLHEHPEESFGGYHKINLWASMVKRYNL